MSARGQAALVGALSAVLAGGCWPGFVLERTHTEHRSQPRPAGCCFHVVTNPPNGARVRGAASRQEGTFCGGWQRARPDVFKGVQIAIITSKRLDRPFAGDVDQLVELLAPEMCRIGGDELIGQVDPAGKYVKAWIYRDLSPGPPD